MGQTTLRARGQVAITIIEGSQPLTGFGQSYNQMAIDNPISIERMCRLPPL
jgi:hypothetical protein